MTAYRFGDYELLRRLGSGGMAEVWLARRGADEVALKRVLPHLADDPRFVEQFLAEARLSARLDHPSVVRVLDVGEVDGVHYLAVEYVHGRPLGEVLARQLARGGPLSAGLAALVVRDVCRGLAHAHAATDARGRPLRLVHRDVGPSNVLVGFDGRVKLADFGVAKALGAEGPRTATGARKGTRRYMAPEQVDGGAIDERTDLYAAGLLLRELLTGRPPVEDEGVDGADAPDPALEIPPLPPALVALCRRAMAPAPRDRFPDAGAMADALDRIVDEEGARSEQLATSLRALFPEAFAPPPVAEPTGTLTGSPVAPARSSRSSAALIALALALALVALALLHRWENPPAAAPVAAAPVAAPQVAVPPVAAPPVAIPPVATPPVATPPARAPSAAPTAASSARRKTHPPPHRHLGEDEIPDPFRR